MPGRVGLGDAVCGRGFVRNPPLQVCCRGGLGWEMSFVSEGWCETRPYGICGELVG